MREYNYLSNLQIDKVKWDNCISNSFNRRIYGLSWYLDLVAANWDAIIYGDYEAVFPVVFKNRILFKKYYHPLFAQQLGLFICRDFNDNDRKKIVSDFFDFALKKIGVLDFCSTSEFRYYFDETILKKETLPFLSFHNVNERVNLEIDLNNNYSNILKEYSTNTIRNLEKAKKKDLFVCKDYRIQDFLSLYKENVGRHLNLKIKHLKVISNLLYSSIKRKKGYFLSVLYKEKMIGSAFFLSCFNRDVLIFHATEGSFKEYHPITYLLNYYIQNNSNNNIVLDFEGSNIPGVFRFYKGFGAQENNYYLHKLIK
jgi:hypothetical protein